MSTFANPNPNTLFELAGTELHFNWGFTAPGTYKVDLQVSAFQGPNQTVPTESHQFMVTFDVLRVPGPRQHAILTQPADPRSAFTGASPGDPVWILPQQTIDAGGKVFLSINDQNVHPADIAAYTSSDPPVSCAGPQEWVEISLLGVTGSGPHQGGQFSLWQTGVLGNPTLWMSTFANPNPNPLFELAGPVLAPS
jgi:surface-anchored protein